MLLQALVFRVWMREFEAVVAELATRWNRPFKSFCIVLNSLVEDVTDYLLTHLKLTNNPNLFILPHSLSALHAKIILRGVKAYSARQLRANITPSSDKATTVRASLSARNVNRIQLSVVPTDRGGCAAIFAASELVACGTFLEVGQKWGQSTELGPKGGNTVKWIDLAGAKAVGDVWGKLSAAIA
ncbi:hypothetical protein BC830DRAFT_1081215 [Chytriomyces sp. MP71]|nr:hypothetical protein BC830DRAFT_1081215 [Chytriomyces sp. MP71]